MTTRPGTPYVLTDATGHVVAEHASKKAAHAAGMAMRRSGRVVFAYPRADYDRLIAPSVRFDA